jgi:F-type H+-transporting ATPase subunit b
VADNKMAAGHDAHGAAPASTHTEADGGHKGGFPPFESDTFASQLVSLAIAFGLLYIIVSRLALPRMKGVLMARQGAIDIDLAEAQKLRDQSDAALKDYESELANARSRAQGIGSDIRDKLNAQAEADRKALEERLAARLSAAEKTIAETRTAAMGNVRTIAVDTAGAIVQRLTGTTPDAGAINSAVDATLKG